MYLLFEAGKRPDVARLREALDGAASLSISHEAGGADGPDGAGRGDAGHDWAELLRDGLTFDLAGLRPGQGADPLDAAFRFDFPEDAGPWSFVTLWPGPHLAGAENSPPVLRGLLQTACDLVGRLDGIAAFGWGPSSSLIGADSFCKTVSAWIDGGPFPALGLVAYRPALDGALESVGLGFLTGQELRIEGELGADRPSATRLAIRLVNELAGAAPLDGPMALKGLHGEKLRMEPSANGRFVRVWQD